MIGAVVAGPNSFRRVLGLTTGARCVFALQAAGFSRIVLVGSDAGRLAEQIATDPRTRAAIEVSEAWPSGGALVIAEGAVVDARATRSLRDAGFGASIADRGNVVAAMTWSGGTADDPLPWGRPVASGAGVLARTTDGAKVAERALLQSLRKPQDGWVATLINRRMSLFLTRYLARTPLRPNTLSVAILALGLWGAWLAAQGTRLDLALGGLLFQLQSVLDGCDGELSRLTYRGSRTGEWLDTVGDDLTNYAFFGCAAVGLHAMGEGSAPLLLGAVGVTIGVITSAIEYAYLVRVGSGDLLKYPLGFGKDPDPAAAPSPIGKLLGAVRPAFKRDFFVFLAMIASFAGAAAMHAMLMAFVAGAFATFFAVMASEIRRRRSDTSGPAVQPRSL